jgi:hypothetical protein
VCAGTGKTIFYIVLLYESFEASFHLSKITMKRLYGLFALLMISGPIFGQPPNITIDTLTDNGLKNLPTCLVIDQENNIHVSWIETITGPAIDGKLMYSRRDCTTGKWIEPELVSDPEFIAKPGSMAVNPVTGMPHIVYTLQKESYLSNSTKVVHAVKDSLNNWHNEYITKDTLRSVGGLLAIDQNGVCHIGWFRVHEGVGRVFYSYLKNDGWVTQVLIDSDFGLPLLSDIQSQLVVSGDGTAHIAFISVVNVLTAYARYASNLEPYGSNWSFETIFTPYSDNYSVKIVLEKDLYLHMFISASDGYMQGPDLIYHVRKEIKGYWDAPVFTGLTGTIKSLVVDERGVIHGLKSDGGNGSLGSVYRYMHNKNGGWSQVMVSDFASGLDFGLMGGAIDVTPTGMICLSASVRNPYPIYEMIVIRSENHCDTIHQNDLPVQFEGEVFVFPNPFVSSTTVLFKNPDNEAHTFELYDGSGQMVLRSNGITTDRFTIQRGHLKSGLYYYRLKQQDKVKATGKVVVR